MTWAVSSLVGPWARVGPWIAEMNMRRRTGAQAGRVRRAMNGAFALYGHASLRAMQGRSFRWQE